jgi:lipopolysaccharide transport protein LptA
MARSRPSNRISLAALVTVGAVGVLAHAPAWAVASVENCRDGIEVESDKLIGNFKNNVTELPNVVVTGCDARIEARRGRATKVDFDDSQWTFDGDVRIHMKQPEGSLKSDQAVVAFRNNQIVSVTITGSPAEFEQKRGDAGGVARGRAGKIVYDLSTGTVTLSDDAWLSDGGKEIKTAQIVYDIGKQALVGTSKPGEGNQRVKITINPKASKPQSGGQNTAPPAGQGTPRGNAPTAAPGPGNP